MKKARTVKKKIDKKQELLYNSKLKDYNPLKEGEKYGNIIRIQKWDDGMTIITRVRIWTYKILLEDGKAPYRKRRLLRPWIQAKQADGSKKTDNKKCDLSTIKIDQVEPTYSYVIRFLYGKMIGCDNLTICVLSSGSFYLCKILHSA